MRHSFFFIVMALVHLSLGCALDEGFGSGNGSVAVPDEGEWLSSALSFQVTENRVATIEFNGFGCVGSSTAAGIPVCESLLSGPVNIDAVIDVSSGSFTLETVFGLGLEGTFISAERVEGHFTYTADNGCCTQAGTWEAVHEALAVQEPPALCHSDVTGMEWLEVGVTTENGAYLMLEEGGNIPAVAGFQGAIMIVAGLRGEGFSLGGMAMELEAEFSLNGVHAVVIAEKSGFEQDEGDTVSWLNLWLILEDENGTLLSPTNQADIDLISGETVELTATIYNTCGFQISTQWSGVLDYSP